MIFSLGHGQRIAAAPAPAYESATGECVSLAKVVGPEMAEEAPPAGGPFGYLFPDAPGDERADLAPLLDALAATMINPEGAADAEGNSQMPAIFTYLGQFIDHDITANTDRDAPAASPISIVTGDDLSALARATVTGQVLNLRQGALNLDSLYGDGPVETAFTDKWRRAMREPADAARMRIGEVVPVGGPDAAAPLASIPSPDGGRADLPRLGDVIDDAASGLTQADLLALDEPLRSDFIENGQPKRWIAVIGDARNDENLLVAQVHMAFLRLHNAVADGLKAQLADPDERFEEARRRTTWIYQWLVVNVYLPKVCNPAVVEAVKASGAALYQAFRERVAPNGPELPLPLEFSVAAFRFGHSMVRGAYDHNRNFGRPFRPSGATFDELFSFTGGDRLGETITGQPLERLAANWPVEWERIASEPLLSPDHGARKIDTNLAHPLSVMLNQGKSAAEPIRSLLKMLAARNLRRGYRLNIPSGQAMVDAINAFDAKSAGYGYGSEPIEPLDSETLYKGSAERRQALYAGGFHDRTPLWFYVLKEAEAGGGEHLGALGSRLVAETLVGLVVADPDSYWHAAAPGSWTPAAVPVDGQAVDGMMPMLRVAGFMVDEPAMA